MFKKYDQSYYKDNIWCHMSMFVVWAFQKQLYCHACCQFEFNELNN